MKRSKIGVWIGVVLISLTQILVLFLGNSFAGTDDQSVDLIQKIAPQYSAWCSQFELFQNDLLETLLFALQGVLGMTIIAIYIIKQLRREEKKNAESAL